MRIKQLHQDPPATRPRNTTRLACAVVCWLAMCLVMVNENMLPVAWCQSYCPGGDVGCPAPEPILETETGNSLYWQDICQEGYRHDGILFHDSFRPVWYAVGENTAMFRDENIPMEVEPIVEDGTLTVGSQDLDADFEHAGRVLLGRSLGDWYRVEFLWMGDYEWSDIAAQQIAADDEFEEIEFNATFRNMELNLRRRVRILSWPKNYGEMEFSTLLGLRTMQSNENLRYMAEAFAETNSADVVARNEMYGVQLGALAQWLYEDRGWIDVEFKGGVLKNDVFVDAFYQSTFVGNERFTSAEDRTAYLADVSLSLNYQFAPAWTLRVAYNAIWLGGIALAGRNVSSNAELPLVDLDHRGEAIYHGPSIGLVYAPIPRSQRQMARNCRR